MRLVVVYAIGLLFGTGISFSGMANPAKIINFFDFAGTWDPSLAFVMGSALIITFVGYRIVLRRSRPMLADKFQIPTNRIIDARLIGGSAIFGIGWGLSGFCPGGALPALGAGALEVYGFVAAMIVGIFVARAILNAGTPNVGSAKKPSTPPTS